MSKRTAQPLPNIILVSQSHTNGLFHSDNDQDALVDCVMENISLACFCEDSMPEFSENPSVEAAEKYISDFAMWKVSCRPNLQFTKEDVLLVVEDLYRFVREAREALGLVKLSDYHFFRINQFQQDLMERKNRLREALVKYIADIIQDHFAK